MMSQVPTINWERIEENDLCTTYAIFLIVTKRKDTIGNFQILWVLNCNFIEFEI